MPSLRILQVLPQLNRGGVERATLDLVAALRKNSSTTYVACENGSLINELIQLGGTHLNLPAASKNPVQMMLNAWSLAKLIRTHNIQIIHARSRAPAWSALWAARWERIPFVTTYHGAYSASHTFKNFYNSVMGRGDRVIAISKFIEQRIKEQHPFAAPNIRLIPEGIDTQTFDPKQIPSSDITTLRKMWGIPLDASIFLLPGRINHSKGHTIFLEALHQLKNHEVWGVILGQDPGDTPYLLKLKDLASSLPVRFIHHVPSLPIAYAAADFIVSPSLVPETFGRVIAEAGAMERIIPRGNP